MLMRRRSTPVLALKVALLGVYFVVMAFPIVWIVLTSIKPTPEIITFPVQYLPRHVTFDHYYRVWRSTNFPAYFKNSMIVSLASAVATTALALFGGYSLARFRFRGKQPTLVLFLITQMIPIVVIIVPLYMVFASLKLIDTLWSLVIVYTVLNIPFCTLLVRGFVDTIPSTLEEAAMVDGATRPQAIVRVILPVVLPGVVATYVFAFIGAWNELFFSVMFLNSEAVKTVPVGINTFIGKYNISWGMMTASAVIALIPSLVTFGIIQRYLIQGLTAGSVKA